MNGCQLRVASDPKNSHQYFLEYPNQHWSRSAQPHAEHHLLHQNPELWRRMQLLRLQTRSKILTTSAEEQLALKMVPGYIHNWPGKHLWVHKSATSSARNMPALQDDWGTWACSFHLPSVTAAAYVQTSWWAPFYNRYYDFCKCSFTTYHPVHTKWFVDLA